ncbi:hypothetical protein ACWGDE_09015 [Streptomyces sp. NPDC054956]
MKFAELIERVNEVADFGVWRGDGNIDEEAIENLEHFSTLTDRHSGVDRATLVSALDSTFETWLGDAAGDGTGRPGVVYLWFDSQARQLRMSFVSGSKIDIPFRIRLDFVSSIDDIVEEFLSVNDDPQAESLKIFARETELN